MTHEHAFAARWLCEHLGRKLSCLRGRLVWREPLHGERCAVGRWTYLCPCGEAGFEVPA